MRRPILNSFLAPASAVAPLNQRAAAIINARRAAGVIVGAVGNGKGGCGKSTLLMNTAIGYGWQGKKVLIIDADLEQLTAGKWPRPEGSENPTIITCPTAEIIGTLARVIGDYDIVLIDLPGRDDRAIASVLEVADILISPSKPSQPDLQELDRYIRVAKARGVPHVVVFNEATRETTGELARLRDEFWRFAPFLPVAIQQLSAYRRVYALGRGVLEISGAHPAKQNFERVFEKLAPVIAGAHAQRVAVLS